MKQQTQYMLKVNMSVEYPGVILWRDVSTSSHSICVHRATETIVQYSPVLKGSFFGVDPPQAWSDQSRMRERKEKGEKRKEKGKGEEKAATSSDLDMIHVNHR